MEDYLAWCGAISSSGWATLQYSPRYLSWLHCETPQPVEVEDLNILLTGSLDRAPTAGGQYHWTSELSPKSCQKFLRYMVGWLSVIGWQGGYASIAFIAGTLIQGLIVLNNPDYIFMRWHGTLLVIVITAFSIIFNTFLAKRLPMVEGLVLIVHILGFFAVLIPLWVLAPRNPTEMVFKDFTNFGGWSSTGLSVMVGMLTTVYGMLGADSAVHMGKRLLSEGRIVDKTDITSQLRRFETPVLFCLEPQCGR